MEGDEMPKRGRGGPVAAYLFLSGASGVIEIGAVVALIRDGASLFMVACVGLAYQLGALVRDAVRLDLTLCRMLSVGAGIGAAGAVYWPWMIVPSVFALSTAIQCQRDAWAAPAHVSTFAKRTARVLGFACAGMLPVWGIAIVALGVVLLCRGVGEGEGKARGRESRVGGRTARAVAVMVVHQAHYFAYCYCVPYVLVRIYDVDVAYTGLIFAVGWVSYVFSRVIFGENFPRRTFIFGHCIAGCALIAMYLSIERTMGEFVLWWFVTGFGGGTVYCLRLVAGGQEDRNIKDKLDRWEDIGHVAGVGVLIGIASTGHLPEVAFIAGAVLAFSACSGFALSFIGRRTKG